MTDQLVVELVLGDQGVADRTVLDEKFIVGKDLQHIVETSPLQLCPVVITGRQEAVRLAIRSARDVMFPSPEQGRERVRRRFPAFSMVGQWKRMS